MIPLFLLLTALVVDVGDWYTHKRQLQNRADAAALAAGVEYRDPDPPLPLRECNRGRERGDGDQPAGPRVRGRPHVHACVRWRPRRAPRPLGGDEHGDREPGERRGLAELGELRRPERFGRRRSVPGPQRGRRRLGRRRSQRTPPVDRREGQGEGHGLALRWHRAQSAPEHCSSPGRVAPGEGHQRVRPAGCPRRSDREGSGALHQRVQRLAARLAPHAEAACIRLPEHLRRHALGAR